MYIGRLGNGSHIDDGIYILLKEILDNSVDEFIMHNGNRINITLKDGAVKVRDFGRGIPLGRVVECVSQMNTGGKYDSLAFQFSAGLNGVGTKAVNALSEEFSVCAYRDGRYASANFKYGVQVGKKKEGDTDQPNGTEIYFKPDNEIFVDYEFREDYVLERLWNYAYLNTGLTIDFNKKLIKSKEGLLDLLAKEVGPENLYPMMHYKSERLEFAFTHNNSYGETYYSYANGQYTSDGGTHQAAFKEGVLKGINEYYKKSWAAPEIRDGIKSAIAIKVINPIFESQTKNKLGNTDVRTWIVTEVKEAVIDILMKNKEVANGLLAKIQSNERIHKEEAAVRNSAKERAKNVAINIKKLRDCKYHLNKPDKKNQDKVEGSMIFLTEGDSASGNINNTRDVETQAVFSLRGKVFNTIKGRRKDLYEKEELYNIMKALGIEDGIEGLRYGKIIIATDADVDGFHIRILLLTYFLTFFEELVVAGRIHILDTPLFRVRNKKETRYCYSEKERDAAVKEIKGAEVTRFKGLGEIDKKEFKQFIGPEMRLIPVTISSMSVVKEKMKFFMDDNTPSRREYIMENLI